MFERKMKYRFFKAFFRRAECHLCRSIVKDPVAHSRWHFDNEEWEKLPAQPMISSFREVVVTDGHVSEDTGWVTNWTGPK